MEQNISQRCCQVGRPFNPDSAFDFGECLGTALCEANFWHRERQMADDMDQVYERYAAHLGDPDDDSGDADETDPDSGFDDCDDEDYASDNPDECDE